MNLVFILLLCLPVIEIVLLISVGGAIGLPLTISVVLLTAVAGTFLLRQQGLSLLFSAQSQVARGQVPAETMAEGVAVAVGGALLLTPGFVTDALGFVCLFPFTRHMMVLLVKKSLLSKGNVFVASSASYHSSTGDDSVTVEGEYKRDE